MRTVFEYINYREFLTDYYHFKKSTVRGFSHRTFLKKAGLKGPNFLKNVMDGKKNLSPASISKFGKALELAAAEARYFKTLVLFNQAKTAIIKQGYFLELVKFRERSSAQSIQQGQYNYFSKWYNIVVREYIHCHPFKDDYATLANALYPKITARQAEQAVNLLKKLGMIKPGQGGFYELTSPIISTGPEVSAIGARQYHVNMIDMAKKSLDKFDVSKRYIRGVTGSFSEETFEEIKMVLDGAAQSILSLIHNDKGDKKVYQMNMQLFPLCTRPIKDKHQ